jgi:hypothetical protein
VTFKVSCQETWRLLFCNEYSCELSTSLHIPEYNPRHHLLEHILSCFILVILKQTYHRGLLSSEMLHSITWYPVTDVSGQPIGTIFNGQAVRYTNIRSVIFHSYWTTWQLTMLPNGRPVTSVTNYQPTPSNMPEERTSITPSRKPKISFLCVNLSHFQSHILY